MPSFSGLGIGLSFVFGCILMGLVAELYYLLWWKKRINNERQILELSNCLFCWKRQKSVVSSANTSTHELTASVGNQQVSEQDLEVGSTTDLQLKGYGEGGVESELMRLHNLCGPPRFLFTIKEENKEDLESEDGKSKGDRSSRKGSRTKSLSDLISIALENNTTPYLTPLSSPKVATQLFDTYNSHGFNPLFESSAEAELNRLRSSPPPKFKFLRDAEEKLVKKLIEEAERRELKNGKTLLNPTAEKEGSFISFLNRGNSTCSQVLPLASSPSTITKG